MKCLILLLFLLIIFSLSCKDEIVQPIQYGSGNNYAIYEQILQNQFIGTDRLVLLSDSTKSESLDTLQIRDLYERFPALLEETLIDYIEKKDNKVKLKNISNIKYIALENEFINNHKPNDTIYIWLSNIGYNNSETQAIVTEGNVFGSKAGFVMLFFLTKDDSEWSVKDQCILIHDINKK